MRAAVGVVLAVCFVVTIVITDHVMQRESVVRGDEVDARMRTPAVLVENVGRSMQTGGKLGRCHLTAPEVSQLYRRFNASAAARPTLLERDGNVPAHEALMAEQEQPANEQRRPAQEATA